jgi:hypothetical protein
MQAILPDFQECRIKKDRFDNIHSDITPIDVAETLMSFSEDFVAKFKQVNLPTELLVEFAHAIEHLDNILEMNNFPKDRLITTPDVVNFGEQAIAALSSNREVGKGVAVSDAVLTNVQDFFDMKYVKTIHMVLEKFKIKGISFVMDGISTFVGLTYQTNHTRFGILSYRVFDEKDGNPGLHIPFLINRLL